MAQSGPPPLTPFRGLIDDATLAVNGMHSNSSSVSTAHAISGDGRYVVFESPASDLVADDTNYMTDIFVRDRALGMTSLVSVADGGSQSNGYSSMASISTNARHVVFASGASNLVPGDTNDRWDIFVRDLDGNRTVRVSVANDGSQLDGDAYGAAISADGRYVAFVSTTTQIAPPASYQQLQAYVRDRDADGNGIFDEPEGTTTSHASVSLSGGSLDAPAENVRISSDGRFVLFETAATNLDPAGNPQGQPHLYVRDRQTGETILIDRSVTGGPSQWGVGNRSSDMTDDGRFITYSSMSNDIVPAASNGIPQVFRYDANADPADRTKLVSALADGTLADGFSYSTSVSADGRHVAFMTVATNLVTPLPAQQASGALVIRDLYDSAFMRIDVMPNGDAFDGQYLGAPAISADGTAIAFYSNATNALDGWYTFNSHHVFVLTAFAVSPQSASHPGAGGSGAIEVNTTPVSGWSASTYDSWIVLGESSGLAPGPRILQYTVVPNDAGVARNGSIRVGSTLVSIHQEGDGDTTPPVITPTVTGTVGGDGWYVSNVTVQWTVVDPESPIVYLGYGCAPVTIATDASYAPITCEATSHGGPGTNTVVIRRDTTPPAVNITVPVKTVYTAGSIVNPSFSCPDAGSGMATCRITQGSTPLDTTPGWHVFTVATSDRAGNSAARTVEYFAGTGQCVTPNESLKGWWPFERNTVDVVGNLTAMPNPSTTLQYANGVVNQAWQGQGMNYLDTNEFTRLDAAGGLTVAAWVRPTGQIGESATIVSKPAQYRIARFPDGTLRWAFSQATGFTWVNTGVVLPNTAWTHIAVSFDGTAVRTYVNGRLAHTGAVSGPLVNAGDPSASMTIGGRTDANALYFGWIDELQVFTAALTASEVEAIALAGNGGLCLPQSSTLAVTVPNSVPYGATFPATATLRDAAGHAIAGRTVSFESYVSADGTSAGGASGTTNATGEVQVQLPASATAVPGTFATGVIAKFSGDARYTLSKGIGSVTLVKGVPAIDWPAPPPIVYGTALTASQLNASANTAGAFAYSPAMGSLLDAGTYTLSATFAPSDSARWTTATATATLVVSKAQPVVTATGGTFTYDTLPHSGSGTAAGVHGEALSPVQVIYDGSSESAPVDAGPHTVRAIYAGSTNYASAESAASLTINKAAPVVEVSSAPVWYTGYPRAATVTIRGVNGVELNPYVVSYDGSTAAPVSAGSYTLDVRFNGNGNYEPVSATSAFVINKATPIMSTLSDQGWTYDGEPWPGISVNIAGVHGDWLTPVVTTYDGSPTSPTNAGVYTVEVRYDGSANYTAAARTFTLTIAKALPRLTWPIPSGITYGTPLSATQLNASAPGVAGTFVYTPTAGTVLNAGAGHALSVTFMPTDAANYSSATANVPINVLRATPTITWPTPADITYGTALGSAQLNASVSEVAGTFAYAPTAGIVLNAGAGQTLAVTFTPADTVNYATATKAVSLNVLKATPTITWPTPADVTYGAALSSAQLNASVSGVAGTFSYTPTAGSVLNAGAGQTLSVTFTPADAANYATATANVPINVLKATPTITWPTPADVTYGAALGSVQLNASVSGVAGTFAYTPAAGTILNAGAGQSLSVTFTPADAANYASATASVQISVLKATPVVDWAAPAGITYGTPLGAAQLRATASVAGEFVYDTPAGTVLNAGKHLLNATFTPDDLANYNGGSRVGVVLIVTQAPLMITANAAAKPFGAPLPAFTASASGFVNGDAFGSLTGSLTFATAATAASPVGAYPVTPQGVSSANYAITFGSGSLSVVPASTATTVAASSNPSGFNQAVTFSAVVSAIAPGAGIPGGAIEFLDGGTVLGTAPLLDGAAALTTNGFAAGGHTITARYSGDARFSSSTGANSFTVNSSSLSSTTTLSSSANPSTTGQSITLTATVQGSGPLSGSVAFYDGSVLIGTVALAGTTARLTTPSLATGGHAITARYLGNGVVPPSTSAAFAQHVQTPGSKPRAPSVSLAASPSPATLGSAVTLNATVTGGSHLAPGGQVLFLVNGTVIGQATLGPTGSVTAAAALAASGLPHGTHVVEAVYLGDSAYRAGVTSITLAVN